MKVKCIGETDVWETVNRSWWFFKLKNKLCKGPKLGDIVTVIGSNWDEGKEYYELMEWPIKGLGWDAEYFIPLETFYEKISISQIKEQPCTN